MRELFQTTDGVWVAVFWLEHNGSLKRFDDAALSGNPELCWKLGVYEGYNLHN